MAAVCRIAAVSGLMSRICQRRTLLQRLHKSLNFSAVERTRLTNILVNVSAQQSLPQNRSYGGRPPMSRQSLGEQILLVLRLYDKVDPEKVTLESRFKEDLGLDSLDRVEVIMAIEDEFGFEIPDQDAEHLTTPAMAVQYIMDKYDILDEVAH